MPSSAARFVLVLCLIGSWPAVGGLAQTPPRARVSLDENWRFIKGDPPAAPSWPTISGKQMSRRRRLSC